jgi:hypothetical protein
LKKEEVSSGSPKKRKKKALNSKENQRTKSHIVTLFLIPFVPAPTTILLPPSPVSTSTSTFTFTFTSAFAYANTNPPIANEKKTTTLERNFHDEKAGWSHTENRRRKSQVTGHKSQAQSQMTTKNIA